MNKFGFYNSLQRNDSYTVKNGDTLYKIAKKYNVSINSIVEANNLASTSIYPGQVIVIPVKVSNGGMYFEEYVIKPDDTLESISQNLGVPVNDISRFNDISRLILMENQVLKIPKDYKTYVVKEDDTLSSILENTNMTLDELVNANINKWLSPGTTINVK